MIKAVSIRIIIFTTLFMFFASTQAENTEDLYQLIFKRVKVFNLDEATPPDAEDIRNAYYPYSFGKIGAKGAVQVSQLADEAQIEFMMMLLAQNMRIIELLESRIDPEATARHKSLRKELADKRYEQILKEKELEEKEKQAERERLEEAQRIGVQNQIEYMKNIKPY